MLNRKEVLRLTASLLCITIFLIIIFYPYEHLKIWREYEGFDKNIIYINPKGYLQNAGIIEINNKIINITTLPHSQPTIHLIGAEMRNFNVKFKVRILNDNADYPFQAKLWEPRTESIVAVDFETASKKIFIDIINKQSNNSYSVIRIPIIYYNLDQEYNISMHIERPNAIYISLNTTISILNNKFLFLNASNGIIQLQSELIEIKPNTTYSLKTLIYPLEGNNVFLLNFQWLDEHGTPLYFSGDWFSLDNKLNKTLNGWYEIKTTYVAPSAAKYAKIVFGIDKGNIALLDNLTLIDTNNDKPVVFYDFNNENILDFFEALSLPSKESIGILQFLKVNKVYTISADMTNLLAQERIALSFFATNTRSNGISQVIVSDYKVIILYNKGWYSDYIEPFSMIPIYILVMIFYGLFLILFHKNDIMGILILTKKFSKYLLREAIIRLGLESKKTLLTIVGIYFIGIIISFHVYDVYSMITWSYVSINYGLRDIYLLPALTSSAPADGGDPYNSFGFPYLILLVYVFYIVGLFREILPIKTTSPIFFDTAFVLMIKIFFLIFIILDAILVDRILKHPAFKLSVNSRRKLVLLFLLNPIIIFDIIIWGQMDSIPLFFMLLTIYFLLNNKHEYVWLSLLIFMLLKQTTFIIGIFMSILLILFFPKKSIIKGLPFGIATIFFILLPLFIIGFSPSTLVLPLVSKILQFGTLEYAEKLSAVTTRDFTNIWTLLTFIMGARGIQIFSFPDYVNIWDSVTPYHIGASLTSIFLIIIIAKTIFIKFKIRQNTLKQEDIVIKYIIIATAILTLTILIFFTRVTARWLIFPVTLLLLLYGQKTLNPWIWKLYFIVTIISSVLILAVIASYQNILAAFAHLIFQLISNNLLFDLFILIFSLLTISFYLLLFYSFMRRINYEN